MTCLIPVCYFPARKLLIDDNQEFAESLMLVLGDENIEHYNSPKKTLEYLKNDYQQKLHKKGLIIDNICMADSNTQYSINININKLKKYPGEDISVIFVDYHMPGMNGLEVLTELQHLPMKKILITGLADNIIAINAFNSGLIDGFIRKDDPDVSTKIKQTIQKMEWQYFLEMSEFIADIPCFNYLKKSSLAKLFIKYIHEKNIQSFYLTHADGDFLLKTTNHETKYLIFRSLQKLHELAMIAKEDGASGRVVDELMNGTCIPFFNTAEYWKIPGTEWENYLYTGKVTDDGIAWRVIDGNF